MEGNLDRTVAEQIPLCGGVGEARGGLSPEALAKGETRVTSYESRVTKTPPAPFY